MDALISWLMKNYLSNGQTGGDVSALPGVLPAKDDKESGPSAGDLLSQLAGGSHSAGGHSLSLQKILQMYLASGA